MLNQFETTDLNLGAAILACGGHLEGLDRTDLSRVRFVFKREEGLDDVIAHFWQGQLKLNPLAFANAQRLLKNRLYQES